VTDPAQRGDIPTSENILDALRSAGWLLEQDTQTALTQAGFHVYPGSAFPDPDDKSVSREIDVVAYRELVRDDSLRVSVGVRIFAECKQSTMPYVLVGRAPNERQRATRRREHSVRFPNVEVGRSSAPEGGTRIHSVSSERYLGLQDDPAAPWADSFVATQMTRLDRKNSSWNATNEGIFTALVYPLAKAVTYYDKIAQGRSQGYVDHNPQRDWASIEYRFPVVVTSATLYAVNVEHEPREAVVVPWATMARHIKTTNVDGIFHIDVTNSDSFERYLQERVGAFAESLQQIPAHRYVTREDLKWGGENPGY